MASKAVRIIAKIIKFIIGAYFAIFGSILSMLLFIDLVNPDWSHEAKLTNPLGPEPPEWYAYALIATAILICYYIAYQMLRRKKRPRNMQGPED